MTNDQLLNQLIPAVPVPFGSDGKLHQRGLDRYAGWMAGQPVGGVAVWAHTGRGLLLSDADRQRVLSTWRRALPEGRVLIAAAGAPREEISISGVIAAACSMARRAADFGADAILVHPPVHFRERPDRDACVLDYHFKIADAGLPVVLFYLYEAAGGISYSSEVLHTLLARPEVLGIKLATLDSVMTFQELVRLVKSQPSPKLIVTGEDRFLGYSLMCGADAALIGMAAACTALQADFLRSYWQGDSRQFLALNQAIDELAQHTFISPMEGYIQRMLWCLVHQGVIPLEAAHDPWGPSLDPSEFDRIGLCLDRVFSIEQQCR
jgi:4-hydroxy-tetrahydrodipicolinate synthase